MNPDFEQIASEVWPAIQTEARRRRHKRNLKIATVVILPIFLVLAMQVMPRAAKTESDLAVEVNTPSQSVTISDQQLLDALKSEGPIIVSLSDGTKRLIRTRPEKLSVTSLAIDL